MERGRYSSSLNKNPSSAHVDAVAFPGESAPGSVSFSFSNSHPRRSTALSTFTARSLTAPSSPRAQPCASLFAELCSRKALSTLRWSSTLFPRLPLFSAQVRVMALVVICGQPCSGKSMAAGCLARALKASETKLVVRIIDEASLHLGRNESYADTTAEKNLRGVLRSEVDRSVSKDNIIIVDSLNNIKGYRYELWCLARGAGIRYCVTDANSLLFNSLLQLFCDVEENICRQWNTERGEQGVSTYDERIFADLAQRFERPDRRNRWDSPLFELMPSRDRIEDSSPAIVEAVSYLTRKIDSKSRDVKALQPTIATQNARVTEANSLYEMDQATQSLTSIHISFQRTVGLPELRSLRRTFMKLTGQASLSGPPPPSDADSAKRMFIEYLNRELAA